MKKINLILLLCFILILACSGDEPRYDENDSLPKGDPKFPPLQVSWVIDKAGVLSENTISQCHSICQNLKKDGIAEMAVLVINKVKKPEEYATHYGRWLKLGKRSLSTEGGNNGLVWLIRPDAEEKMTISIGRGLPKFTSSDYGQIMDEAKDYLNFNNFDEGVTFIVSKTDQKLREIYNKN